MRINEIGEGGTIFSGLYRMLINLIIASAKEECLISRFKEYTFPQLCYKTHFKTLFVS